MSDPPIYTRPTPPLLPPRGKLGFWRWLPWGCEHHFHGTALIQAAEAECCHCGANIVSTLVADGCGQGYQPDPYKEPTHWTPWKRKGSLGDFYP